MIRLSKLPPTIQPANKLATSRDIAPSFIELHMEPPKYRDAFISETETVFTYLIPNMADVAIISITVIFKYNDFRT